LIQQVDHAIDIFEGKTNGFATGLFIFDNAPSHQKRALDALSARKMTKNPHKTWQHHKDGLRMRSTVFGPHQESGHFLILSFGLFLPFSSFCFSNKSHLEKRI